MQAEFEARPDVVTLPAGYDGEVPTGCHTIRIRNTGAAPLTLNVSGTPFAVAVGASWGIDSGDVRSVILRPLKVTTGTTTALVERIYQTKL